MSRRTVVSFAALGAFTVLAFGSMGGNSSFDLDSLDGLGAAGGGKASAQANIDRCLKHIAHWNSFECLKSVPRDAKFCETFRNDYVDYTGMFDCWDREISCEGPIPKLDGMSGCSAL